MKVAIESKPVKDSIHFSPSFKYVFPLASLAVLSIVHYAATPYMTIAVFAYLCFVAGILQRKNNKKAHAIFMSLGMVTDLSLVLFLQFTRDAIGTATSFTLPIASQFHIAASTIALVLYFPVFYLGYARLKNESTFSKRTLHIRLGIAAFAFRTIGLVLMFSLLDYFIKRGA